MDDIIAAMSRIEQGETPSAVARSSPLKSTSIYKYMKMREKTGSIQIGKWGAKPFMPLNLVEDLVTWIAAMQRAGWPVEPYEVIIKSSTIVAFYAGVSCTVGRGWYARFAKRQHELAPQVAQSLSRARNAVTKNGITRFFFDLVKDCLGFRCTAADVYNVDETRFKTKGKNKKVVQKRVAN
ncbi:Aste57867_2322 [Aphanomyces stellatus]|uniref:Aste57867_2322 protein n=1 Tax=Aphanomyces stellatus TaxID=120398 RepID=A0A485K9V7_9STRA|nr:hypothetical protein As57867_002317 [Aphanomyces stellatus]VFT79524.1 Aste57867_2322 [Aphanomyces stellatus]